MPPERRALFCTFWFRFQDGFRVLTNQDLLLNSSALCSGFRRTMNLPMQWMPRWTTFFPYGQMGTRQGGKRATWERACVKDRRSPGNYSKCCCLNISILHPRSKLTRFVLTLEIHNRTKMNKSIPRFLGQAELLSKWWFGWGPAEFRLVNCSLPRINSFKW